MTELEQLCENALYDEIRILEDGKSVVRDVPTGKLYCKKTLDVYNEHVYEYLKAHRNKNVAAIQAYWKEEDKLVVIEELIQGRTLDEILSENEQILKQDRGPDPSDSGVGSDGNKEEGFAGTTAAGNKDEVLTFSERIDILSQICDGLQFLHSADPPIIHRDIKASNIMVTDDGIVKIIDYDAAKIYITGQDKDTMMIGTQGLAAPEQYGFAQSDVRTDLYALGKLIGRMLPGNVDADRIEKKATQMDPKKRYTSAEQMKGQIRRIREHVSGPDRLFERFPGYDPMSKSHRIRARAGLAAACAAVTALIAFGVWAFVIHPAKVAEQRTAALEAIVEKSASGKEIDSDVMEFAITYPYASMNPVQQKAVRDGMTDVMRQCYEQKNVGEKEKEAKSVCSILTDKYGSPEIWEACCSYAKAGYHIDHAHYDRAVEILHELVKDGATDAGEHWDADALKIVEAARKAFREYEKTRFTYALNTALEIYMVLLPYSGEIRSVNVQEEAAEKYTAALVLAESMRSDKDWDSAISVYTKLQTSGLADYLEKKTAEADHSDREDADQSSGTSKMEALIKEAHYEHAEVLFAEGSYKKAVTEYSEAKDYRDAADKQKECVYRQGCQALEEDNYNLAIEFLEKIPGYKDTDALLLNAKFSYCEKEKDAPGNKVYTYIEELAAADYEGYEELRDEIYRWKVVLTTGMSYSLGPMQSAYIKAALRGGPPDGTAVVRFELYDFASGTTLSYCDEEEYKRGETAACDFNEDDSSYDLFDRTYRVNVYLNGERIVTWEGQFSREF